MYCVRERLPVMLRPRDDDAVDEDARNLHLSRVEAAAVGDPLDLGDDDAARIVRRHGDGERLQRQRLLFHGEIPVGVAGGGADDPDVDRKSLVGEAFLARDRDALDEVLLRAGVELAPAVLRIDEGLHADAGQVAGPTSGDVAEEMGDDALRQIVGLDEVVDRELLDLRHETPVPTDHPLDEALMAEVVEALLTSVALPCRIDERQVPRLLASERKRSSRAMAISSAQPMATKPPVATVSPSRMNFTASAAVTTLPFSGERNSGRVGYLIPCGMAGLNTDVGRRNRRCRRAT